MAGSQRVSVQVLGNELVERRLIATGDRGADVAPVWPAVLSYMYSMIEGQFESQGSEGGQPWKPISDRWSDYKARHGLRPEILRATDDMYESLTLPRHPEQIAETFWDKLIFGSRVEYFAAHQEGDPGNVPPRPMVVFQQHNVNIVSRQILDYVLSAWGGARFIPPQGAGGRFLPGYVIT